MLYDIITTFGDLSEEAKDSRKYAKWKATYIHNCLKNGETPHAGPLPSEEDELVNIGTDNDTQPGTSSNFGWNTNPYDQPIVQTSVPEDVPPQDELSNIRLPDPPKEPEEKNPGGFVPFDPEKSNIPVISSQSSVASPEMLIKAQKYTKFAQSALTYDDVPTAIDNLQKALKLLTTGQDS